MPEATYYNIVSLLDLIQNNEINLKATVDELEIDLNINLCNPLTIQAKTKILGETLWVKFVNAENKQDQNIYISYKGLNVYANINDIQPVINKLKPIIPALNDFDFSKFKDIKTEDILNAITVSDNENGLTLTLSDTLLGFGASVLLETDGDKFTGNIVATVSGLTDNDTDNSLTVNVVPSEKADYDMPQATYYNIVTLLNVIDDEGRISLTITIEQTEIQATIDLQNMLLYAGVEGVEIFANLNTGNAYVRYPGVQGKVNFDDLNGILEQVQPIIDKFVGDTAIGGLDLSAFDNIDVESIINSVNVDETDETLAVSLTFNDILVTVNCSTENGDLTFANLAVALDGMNIAAVKANEAFTPYFDETETYVSVKELVDTFGTPLCDVLTSDTLSATLSGKVRSGSSTITINGSIDLSGLTSTPQAKVSFTVTIAETQEDNSVKETSHEILLIYKDLSLVADGTPNVYFTYNNLSVDKKADDKFEGVFTTAKIDDTLEILKNIYKNMPELQDSLKFIFVADEQGYPTIPEASVDLANLFNDVTLANGILSVDLNGSAFMSNLSTSIIANLSNESGMLALNIPTVAIDKMTVKNLSVTLGKPADGTVTDDMFAFTTDNAVDFSSMNELLSALETTSRYRSFSITGKVSMKALSLFNFTDKATITAQLEIINNKTYAVVKLEREPVTGVWNDYDGYATLYFDPEEQMIYIKDSSRTRSWGWISTGRWTGYFGYTYTTTTTYKKYTVEEFTADIKTPLLDMLHFADGIRSQIDKPSDHVSYATIENTFLGYSYNGADTFSIDLDLEPLIGDIQDVHLDIGHGIDNNGDIYINTLYAEMTAVSVLDVKLNASLTTHEDRSQGLYRIIVEERSRTDYQPAA